MVIKKLYMEMDNLLGKVMDSFDLQDPNLTLMVMSDHGLLLSGDKLMSTPGCIKMITFVFQVARFQRTGYFSNVDWLGSTAYALGINSLYINLEGGKNTAWFRQQRLTGLEEIRNKLLSLVDPATGHTVVSRVWILPPGEQKRHPHAPDMIIDGRAVTGPPGKYPGGFSKTVIRDNDEKWSVTIVSILRMFRLCFSPTER